MRIINIGNKKIGGHNPCFIILEVGINHNGELDKAIKMIDVAVSAGADAIKFQTFTAGDFITDKTITYTYKSQGKEITEPMIDMFERCQFSDKDWEKITDYCKEKGIIFFSTTPQKDKLDLVLKLGSKAVKVGSDDLVNLPLLDDYSKKGVPMIIATGMSYLSEVDEAVRTIQKNNKDLIILHCVSSYPAQPEDLNMNKIKTLQTAYPDCVVGFSDHSQGAVGAALAIALGAKVYEKHFTLDHNLPGPDHWFSADTQEVKEVVKAIRQAEQALGSPCFEPSESEIKSKMRELCHRSMAAKISLKKGDVIAKDDIVYKLPGTGIMSKYQDLIVGRVVKEEIKKGELITKNKLI